MEQKLKKIFTDKNFYIFMLITFMFFGIFVKLEYALDTYCVFEMSTKSYCEHFLMSGRPISALFLAVTRFLKFTPNGIYTTSFIIAIIATIASLYILFNIIKKDLKNELISMIISVLIVINIFSIELYLFLEKGIMMLSVLFCILALKQFVNYLKEEQNKYIVYTFIYMLLANFSYQGTVGLFVALCTVYIAKNANDLKKFIKDNVIAAICYGIPALINYLMIKYLFNNVRVSSEFHILESLKLIIRNTILMLKDTYNIIPKYIFILTLGIMIIFFIITILKKEKEQKGKAILVLKLFYVGLATYMVTVFPQILQSTNSIGFAPRNTYTFASIIGIVFLYLNLLQAQMKKSRLLYILVPITILYLIVQYVGFMEIERNRYILNYTDYYNAMQIKEKVDNYENETGNKINKIAVYIPNVNSISYPDLFLSGDINIKATFPEWSRIIYLKYYLNRELEQVEEDDRIFNQYFKDKNWKYFDTDQIVLVNDTLHFCIY